MTTGEGFRADLDGLAAHAHQVAELADSVESSRPSADAISPDAYGVIGSLFAGTATTAMAAGAEAVSRHAAGVRRLAERLDATATAYRDNEQTLTDAFAGVVVPRDRY